MAGHARPLPTKLAAAVLAAGLVAGGATATLPVAGEPAARAVEVANASTVTDLLLSLGDIPYGITAAVTYGLEAVWALPFDVVSAALVGLQDPGLTPSLVSWLVQRYANPSNDHFIADFDSGGYHRTGKWFSYPWALLSAVELVATTVPLIGVPIAQSIDRVGHEIGAVIEGALPDPDPGGVAFEAFEYTELGRAIAVLKLVGAGPLWAVRHFVEYVAHLPADLEATVEAAAADPTQLGGLVSWLAHELLNPGLLIGGDPGLLGRIAWDLVYPVAALPSPLGTLAMVGYLALAIPSTLVLAQLPMPVNPYRLLAPGDPGREIESVRAPAGDRTTAEPLRGPVAGVGASGDDRADARAETRPVPADADGTEEVEPPAEDVLDAGQVRTARLAPRIRAGNKFVPGAPAAAAEPAAGAAGRPPSVGETDSSAVDPGTGDAIAEGSGGGDGPDSASVEGE